MFRVQGLGFIVKGLGLRVRKVVRRKGDQNCANCLEGMLSLLLLHLMMSVDCRWRSLS